MMRHWFLTRPDNSRTYYMGRAECDKVARIHMMLARDVREWVIVSSPDRWRLT